VVSHEFLNGYRKSGTHSGLVLGDYIVNQQHGGSVDQRPERDDEWAVLLGLPAQPPSSLLNHVFEIRPWLMTRDHDSRGNKLVLTRMLEGVVEKAVADFLQRVAASDQLRERGLMFLQQGAEQSTPVFETTVDRGRISPGSLGYRAHGQTFLSSGSPEFLGGFQDAGFEFRVS